MPYAASFVAVTFMITPEFQECPTLREAVTELACLRSRPIQGQAKLSRQTTCDRTGDLALSDGAMVEGASGGRGIAAVLTGVV